MTRLGGARWALVQGRGLVGDTGRLLRGRDLSAASATLTYFSAIALVPWLVLAVWTTTWTSGGGRRGAGLRLDRLRVLVPPDLGGRPAYDALVHSGTHVAGLGLVVLLLPASFYGEGLRRAFLEVLPQPDHFTGWRARLLVMALVLTLPGLAWVFVGVGGHLAPLAPEGGGGGAGDLVVRVLVAFTCVWLLLSLLLTWVFRMVAPGRTRWWVALAGALATGSFLAGFLQGFTLFLSLPIDVGSPYAGLSFVGGAVAVGLWLYLLHTVVLVGWVATRALDARVDARVLARAGAAVGAS